VAGLEVGSSVEKAVRGYGHEHRSFGWVRSAAMGWPARERERRRLRDARERMETVERRRTRWKMGRATSVIFLPFFD
jgi:hypothetical protein